MVTISKVLYVFSHWLIGLGFSLIHVSVSCAPKTRRKSIFFFFRFFTFHDSTKINQNSRTCQLWSVNFN